MSPLRQFHLLAISLFREAVAATIRWTGFAFLISNTLMRNKVSILVYHDPSPEILERHLRYLEKHYNLIPLARLVDAIYARDWHTISQKSLVITFDDGLKRNFALLELFRRYSVRPTIYLCSQIVDTNRHHWFFEIDSSTLKSLPNEERLRMLEQTVGFTQTREYRDRRALNKKEIAEMLDCVDFQSHSRFHPVLTTCSDMECESEISRSRFEIANITGQECLHFSYPNGDYTSREIRLLKEAGYLSARSLDLGWNTVTTDPFRLRVLAWRDDASVNRLVADLSGISGYLGRLRRGSLTGRWRSIRPREGDGTG